MKTFAAVAAVATAALFSQAAAYDNSTACPTSEIVKLLTVADDPYLAQCEADSGYSFVPPTALPTETQIVLMCLSSDCASLIADIIALEPADCVIDFGEPINVLELVESYAPDCAALGL